MARRRLSPTIAGPHPGVDPDAAAAAEAGIVVPRAEQMPEERPRPAPGSAPGQPGPGRGPALGPALSGPPIARVAAEAAGRAALDEVVETLRRAQAEGRMVLAIPLDDIAADHIARDRIAPDALVAGPDVKSDVTSGADEEMVALRESLRAHGQRMPIEVTPLRGPASDEGRDGGFARGPLPYGLISGWRRLAALRALHAETGEERFATVRALIRQPENAAEAYVAMVEENEIRLGLGQYERARIAAIAARRGVFPSEPAALRALFATASRAKRSRIRAFIEIYHALDDALRFPAHLPERLGLRLVELLRAGHAAAIAEGLGRAAPADPEAERVALDLVATRLEKGAAAAISAAAAKSRGEGAAWSWERIGPDLELGTRGGGAPELRLRGAGLTPDVAEAIRAALRDGERDERGDGARS